MRSPGPAGRGWPPTRDSPPARPPQGPVGASRARAVGPRARASRCHCRGSLPQPGPERESRLPGWPAVQRTQQPASGWRTSPPPHRRRKLDYVPWATPSPPPPRRRSPGRLSRQSRQPGRSHLPNWEDSSATALTRLHRCPCWRFRTPPAPEREARRAKWPGARPSEWQAVQKSSRPTSEERTSLLSPTRRRLPSRLQRRLRRSNRPRLSDRRDSATTSQSQPRRRPDRCSRPPELQEQEARPESRPATWPGTRQPGLPVVQEPPRQASAERKSLPPPARWRMRSRLSRRPCRPRPPDRGGSVTTLPGWLVGWPTAQGTPRAVSGKRTSPPPPRRRRPGPVRGAVALTAPSRRRPPTRRSL